MNCEEIEKIVSELKVNSKGAIRGKGRVIDKLNVLHLKEVNNLLTDLRIKIAIMSTDPKIENKFLAIDELLYKKQVE